MNKTDLILGQWYKGNDRLSGGIGLWNGYEFIGYCYTWGEWVENAMDYYPDVNYQLLYLGDDLE